MLLRHLWHSLSVLLVSTTPSLDESPADAKEAKETQKLSSPRMDSVSPELKTLSSRSIKQPVAPAPNSRQPSSPPLTTYGSQATASTSTKQQVLPKELVPNQQQSIPKPLPAIKQQTFPFKQQQQSTPPPQPPASKQQSATKKRPTPPPQQSQILKEESTDVPVLPSKTAPTMASNTETKPNYGIKTFAEIMAEKRAKKAAEEASASASAAAAATTTPEQQQKSTNNSDGKVIGEIPGPSKSSEPKKPPTRLGVHPTNGAKINGKTPNGSIAERNGAKVVAQQTNTMSTTNPSQKRTANTAVLPASMKLSPKKQRLDRTNPVDPREQSELKSVAMVDTIPKTTSSTAKRSRSQETEQDLRTDALAVNNKRAKSISPSVSTPAAPPAPITVATFALTTNTNKKIEQEEPITPMLSADLYGEFGVLDEADLAELNAIAPEELADFDLEAAKLELGI